MEWFVSSSEDLEGVEYQEVGPFHVQKRRSNEQDIVHSQNGTPSAPGTAPRAEAGKPVVEKISAQKAVRYSRTA